ncbi:MAG: hypothetical protein RI963_1633 [Planctomycetota bacterium]
MLCPLKPSIGYKNLDIAAARSKLWTYPSHITPIAVGSGRATQYHQ